MNKSKSVPTFRLELDTNGFEHPSQRREYMNLYFGTVSITDDWQDPADSYWSERVRGAIELVKAAGGTIEDRR